LLHPRFAASAICRFRDLLHPRSGRLLARSAWRGMRCGLVRRSVRAPPYAPADGARAVGLLAGVCPASGADRASGGFWRVLGAVWREAPARNAVRSGTPVGARATIRASGRRARGRASGLVLARSGFLVASGAFWAVSPGTGVIEAAQVPERRMSRLIRSQAVSPGNGHARSGTGVSCGAARRVADDTSEAKRMIPRAPARGIRSEAKPDQKRRAQDQSGAQRRE
jgi:hypothetical protein